MGESNDRWFSNRRRRTLAIVAVVIAAVTIGSAVAVVVSRQIADYHDAKYRAQYVIIQSFSTVTGEASRHVSVLINENASLDERFEAADDAWWGFMSLYVSAEELRVMYLDDDQKSGPLLDFREAFAAMKDAMSESKAQLMGPDYSFKGEMEQALKSGLNASLPMLDDLITILGRSYDAGRSAMEHPYSLIDRMDLAALQQTSRAIADTLSEWRPAVTQAANIL